MAHKRGKRSITATLFSGRRETNPTPIGIAKFYGKTVGEAEKTGRKFLKNVAAGFYDSTGFHPIRASADYDSMRTGEAGRKRVYGTKAPITRAAAAARRKKKARKPKGKRKNPRKRKKLSFGQRMARLRARKAAKRRR